MNKYYFTFGSDEQFPYTRDDYVMVFAPTAHIAVRKFQKRHPNRPGSPFVNCADIYNEDHWTKYTQKYYEGVRPIEVIS